jgi:hypothetical protein
VVRRQWRARRGGVVAPAATATTATTAATAAAAVLAATALAWDPCSPPATFFASPGTRAVCEAQQAKERREAPATTTTPEEEEQRPAPSPAPAPSADDVDDAKKQRAASRQLVRDILASDGRARTQELVDAAVGIE